MSRIRGQSGGTVGVVIAACLLTIVIIGGLLITSPQNAVTARAEFSTTDLLNISIAMLALSVGVAALRQASQQVELGRRQVRLAEEQTASAVRQEMLDKELADITRRQAAIVEGQNKIFKESQLRKPNLSIIVQQFTTSEGTAYRLALFNDGVKTPREVDFLVWYTTNAADKFFENIQFASGTTHRREMISSQEVIAASRLVDRPLFVNRPYPIADFRLKEGVDLGQIKFLWKLICEDGEFPPIGHSVVTLDNPVRAYS